MTNSWQDIIEQQNTLTTSIDLTSTHYFMPLAQLGILQITGDDAQNFLQNLLTNDVNLLALNQGQLSGFCNAKGRLFSVFQLIRRQDGYQIVLPKTMCTILMQRLSMYILRSKVTISDVSDTMACIGLSTSSDNAITELALSDDYVFSYEKNPKRALCIAPTEQVSELVTIFNQQQWQLTPNSIWDNLDIKSGIPAIFPETKEKFTPQQVNLDLVEGVSFTKGCYPGQEVVARLHYLGKPSRRMFYAETNTEKLPIIGDEVLTETGNIAGHIVHSQTKNSETVQLLLSLKLSEQKSKLFINDTMPIELDIDSLNIND